MPFFIHNFGKNLSRLRKEKELTQDELAQIIGVQKAAISKIESGTSYPTFANLDRIAEFFNATPNQLFGTPTQIELENSVYKTDEYVEKTRDILQVGQLIHDIENDRTTSSIFNDLLLLVKGKMITDKDGEPLTYVGNGKYSIAEYEDEIAYEGSVLSQINQVEPKINELIDKIHYIKDNQSLLKDN